MRSTENDEQIRQRCEAWLANRGQWLLAKSTARETDGAHFLLNPSVFDPESLVEPLRSMAMRALEYPKELISGGPDVRRTFTDFARLHLPRGDDVAGVEVSLSFDDV